MALRICCFFSTVLLAMLCSPPAWSSTALLPGLSDANQIQAQAYWIDKSGQMPFEDVIRQDFTSYSAMYSGGYEAGASWFRLEIPALTRRGALMIQPAWLDQLAVYDTRLQTEPRLLGDHFPPSNSAFSSLGHVIWLEPWPESRMLWVKLSSTSAHVVDFALYPVNDVPNAVIGLMLWPIIYLVSLFAILIGLVSIWWINKDKMTGIFTIRHFFFIWYVFAFLGFPQILYGDAFGPAFYHYNFSLAALCIIPLGIWFDIFLLKSYRANKYLLSLLKLSIVVSLALIVLFLLGHERKALSLNTLLLMVILITAFIAALGTSTDRQTGGKALRVTVIIYYGLLVSGLVISLLGVNGVIKPQMWTLRILVTDGILTSAVMLGLLYVRSYRIKENAKRIEWELGQARHNLKKEQAVRENQSNFLYMLMHELKTPLSIISLVFSRDQLSPGWKAQVQAATQDMSSILNRSLDVDRLEHDAVSLSVEPINIRHVLQDVLNKLALSEADYCLNSSDSLPAVESDRNLITVVLSNLISNAVNYKEINTVVEINVACVDVAGQVGIEICVGNMPGNDNWPDADKVFNKYYRASQSQRKSGSGLGLYLSKSLASMIHAELFYQPTETKAIFVFRFTGLAR